MKLKGFTLIEMVISIVVLGIVGAVLTPTISQAIDLFLMTRTQEVLARESRFALNWMSEEIKTNCETIDFISATRLKFTTCLTCDPVNKKVIYIWDNTQDVLTRIVTDLAEGILESDDILAEKVTFAEFSLFNTFNLNTGAGETGSVPAGVNLVQIRLDIEDATGTKTYNLVTRVMPRNL